MCNGSERESDDLGKVTPLHGTERRTSSPPAQRGLALLIDLDAFVCHGVFRMTITDEMLTTTYQQSGTITSLSSV